jgi:hypothetical protein
LHSSLSTVKHAATLSCETVAHYVDRRYMSSGPSKLSGPSRPNRPKKCFVCGRPGCWSTNHSTKERLQAFRGNKVLRQFVTSLDDGETDEEDCALADTLEEITAHIIDVNYSHANSCHANDDKEPFSHMATIEDTDGLVSFTARHLDATFSHALTAKIPHSRFGNIFQGVMIDTGCARGSSGGHAQYIL